MKRKNLREFIREHREEIDQAVRGRVNTPKLNDNDRREWILNDESLYLWAKSEGVKI